MAQDPNEMTPPAPMADGQAPAVSPSLTAAQVRSDIAETRAEMTETIDAIQERLSPSRVMTQAKDTVKEATVGRPRSVTHAVGRTSSSFDADWSLGARRIVQMVKDHPLPLRCSVSAPSGSSSRPFGTVVRGRPAHAERRWARTCRRQYEQTS
jgi:Protein of unknown function (DUF3618)